MQNFHNNSSGYEHMNNNGNNNMNISCGYSNNHYFNNDNFNTNNNRMYQVNMY